MAISYVGGATASSAGNTDVSVDLTALTGGSDSSPSNGDLVIFAFNIADADNVDLNLVCNTADFAEIADLFGNGTQDANLGVFWKIMGATPDTAVVGEGSTGGTDTSILAAVMVFRGVDQTTPFDVAATTATGTTGGLPDPPSIDWSTAGAWTVVVGANAHAAGSGGAFTAPTNYTTDFLTIGDVNDTADGIIGMGYNSSPSDPENPGQFADNVAATGWCAVTMALRPAPTVENITGTAAQAFSNSATLAGKGLLAGTCALSFANSAALTGRGALAGTAGLSFSNSAALTTDDLVGVLPLTFTNSGTLTGRGALAGTSAASFTNTAALSGRAPISGSSALSFSPSATLSSVVLTDDNQTANSTTALASNSTSAAGQSFTGDGNEICRVEVSLSKIGTPSGSVVVKIYAHSGTFGTNGIPTGDALAESNSLSTTVLTGSAAPYLFQFSPPLQTVNGTKYVLAIEVASVSAPSNFVVTNYHTNSDTHDGNRSSFFSSSWSAAAGDLYFQVFSYEVAAGNDLITGVASAAFTNSATLTGSGALAGTAAMAFANDATLNGGVSSIDGTAALAFTNSAALSGRGELSGSADLAFSETASLGGSGALAGTAALAFTNSAALAGDGALGGVVSIAFTDAAVLVGRGALAGSSPLSFLLDATLQGSGALAGTSSAAFTLDGTLLNGAAGQINGSTSLTFTNSAVLTGRGALAGAALMAFDDSGALSGRGRLDGALQLSFAPTASLEGDGELEGQVAAAFMATALLAGKGSLAGTAGVSFTNSAALGGEIPGPGDSGWPVYQRRRRRR